jgi:hypothetical protein
MCASAVSASEHQVSAELLRTPFSRSSAPPRSLVKRACRVRPPQRGALTSVLAATAEGSAQPCTCAAQDPQRSPFWPPRNPATVTGPKNAGNPPFLHRSPRGARTLNRGGQKAGVRCVAISPDFRIPWDLHTPIRAVWALGLGEAHSPIPSRRRVSIH